MNRIIVSFVIIVGFLVPLYLLWNGTGNRLSEAERASMDPMSPIDPPRLLPEFSFFNRQGRRLSLEDYRGKVVLLNIWATWCPPCREEMPSLDRLQSRLGGRGFEVLALSTDRQGADVVWPFYQRAGIQSLEIFIDQTGAAEAALKIPGLPTSMLIDRSGAAVAVRVGPAQWDNEEIIALIEQELVRAPNGE